MKAEAFGGVLRAVLAAAGGYLVGSGKIDQATFNEVAGALVTIAVAVWSIANKKKLTSQAGES